MAELFDFDSGNAAGNASGLLGRLGQGIANNPLTLMALGGGIAQGGIGRGLTAAAPISFAERAQHQQQIAQAATFQALRNAGMPEGVAQAAALRPDILKAIASEYFGAFKVVQTGEDLHGRKIFQLQGPGGKLYKIPDQNPESSLNSHATLESLKQTPVDHGLKPSGPILSDSPVTTLNSSSQNLLRSEGNDPADRQPVPKTDQANRVPPETSQQSQPESPVPLHHLLAVVEALKQNPRLLQEFDPKYVKGAAKRAL